MLIFPSIDLSEGKVVRLVQGRMDQKTVYSANPLEQALDWRAEGVEWLHVVDLDGAMQGEPLHLRVVRELRTRSGLKIQFGGGLRHFSAIENAFEAGAQRVILGSMAVKDPELLKLALARWGDLVAVSLDLKDDSVATEGWTQSVEIKPLALLKRFQEDGVARIIVTDVNRDGSLMGPNWKLLDGILKAATVPIIFSGGVAGIEDVKKAANLRGRKLEGLIIGKALYEGNLTMTEAIQAAQ